MKELREFVRVLKEEEFKVVSLGEVFGEENVQLIELKDLLNSIKEIGVKEVTDTYYESFEFFANDGKYMSINAVY